MNDEYTPEDFANARFAEHTDGRIAMRAEPETGIPWYVGDDQIKRLDADMAARGWRPVVEVEDPEAIVALIGRQAKRIRELEGEREPAPLTLDSAVSEMQEKAWDECARSAGDMASPLMDQNPYREEEEL